MPKARRRRYVWTLPVFLLAGTLLFLRTDVAARLGRQLLEQVLEQRLGEDFTIGRLTLEYYPPRIGVIGLVITHAGTGDTIAVVKELSATAGREGWRPVLRRVEIVDPVVHLHLDQEGLREFRALKPDPNRTPTPPAARLPWEELVVSGGRFRLESPDAQVDLNGIFISPDGPDRLDLVVGYATVTAGPLTQHASGVVFENVVLTPQRLVLPSIRLRTEAIVVEGSLAGQPGDQVYGDLSVGVELPALMLGLGHPGKADGRLDLDLSISGPFNHPGLGGVLSGTGLALTPGPGKHHRFGDVVAPFEIVLPGEGEVGYGRIYDLSWPFATGRVDAEARYDLGSRLLTATVRGESVDLATVLSEVGVAPTPWVTFDGDLEATLVGTLSPLLLEGPLKVMIQDLWVKSGPVRSDASMVLDIPKVWLDGSVRLDEQHLIFVGDRVVSGRSHGRARASIGIGANTSLLVTADFPALDLSVLQPLGGAGLGGMAELHGRLEGQYGDLSAQSTLSIRGARVLGFPIADQLNATLISPDLKLLRFPDAQALRGNTSWSGLVEIGFPATGMTLGAGIDLQGRLRDITSIFADLGDLDGDIAGRVDVAGEVFHLNGGGALTLRNVGLYGEQFREGRAVGWMRDGRFSLEKLLLTRPGQPTESLLAHGSIGAGWQMNMGVLWDGATLQGLDHLRARALPLEGRLMLDAQVGGTLFEPEPRGRLELTDLLWQRRPVEDSLVEFHTEAGVLAWKGSLVGNGLETTGTLGLWDEQPYRLHGRLDQFPLDVFYPEAADGQPVRARLSGEVGLGGFFGDNPTPVDIFATLPGVDFSWGDHHLTAPEPWSLEVHGRSVQVRSLSLTEPARGVRPATRLYFSGEALADGRVEFVGDGSLDLDLIRAVAPGILEAEGSVPVSLRLSREPGETAIRSVATAKLRNAYLDTEYFPAPFENVAASIEATPEQWVIRDFRAALGGGTVTSELSTIGAENWWPARFSLNAVARSARVQYLDYLPPMLADAELFFDGPVDSLLLSGKIRILDMQFRERVDWESMVLSLQADYLTDTAPEESKAWFGMDLSVDAEETVHLRNNVADADASAALRIVGDTARPGMTGEIRMVPGGRVYLQDREFEVARGELRYMDPYTFDPDLDIELNTEISSQDQDYRIRYLVSGPFSDWSTTASSDPGLSQADINALLLFGVTREEMERGGYGNLGTALAVETGGLLSASLASSNPTAAVLDRFINRWTLVSGVTERGSKTVSNEPRLVAESSQIGGFTFTGEFSFGGDWYVSVERRIASRLYAAAYATTDQVGRSMPFAAVGTEFKFRFEGD